MPRTIRSAQLETRAARERLKPRSKPYYQALDEGLHLGYRRNKVGGKWVARYYEGDERYTIETLAIADDNEDADGFEILSYRQAQQLARQKAKQRRFREAGVIERDGPYTVADAIEDYLGWMASHRKGADDARIRAEALILPELGSIEVERLTTNRIRNWLDGLITTPARLRSAKGQPQRYRDEDVNDPDVKRKRRANANRVMTILKAALNHAWREGIIDSDAAWRRVKPFSGADAARVQYLTVDEVKRFLNACDTDFRPLVQVALVTGARYGELARLTVDDFNRDAGTVRIIDSKNGKPRHIVLTEEGTQVFEHLTTGRFGHERLLTHDGKDWGRSHQQRPVRETSERARISPPVSFHTLRHTYASLAVMNGLPLMVLARNLGHADTRMVEKHYGHLANDFITEAIRTGAPQYGIVPDTKVVSINGR